MKKLFYSLFVIIVFISSCSSGGQQVVISTDFGDMTVLLYDETPKHRDNFIKLVKDGYYDDLLFHRVINRFMIQGGDPNSRDASPTARLGSGGPGYKIPAEIAFPHFKGALAAAQSPNPQKQSSGSQFYIVHGAAVNDAQLDNIERSMNFKYTTTERARYKEIGGYPGLDMNYTVFGEVIDGFDVIDKIATVQTNGNPPQGTSRPLEDVKMRIRLK